VIWIIFKGCGFSGGAVYIIGYSIALLYEIKGFAMAFMPQNSVFLSDMGIK